MQTKPHAPQHHGPTQYPNRHLHQTKHLWCNTPKRGVLASMMPDKPQLEPAAAGAARHLLIISARSAHQRGHTKLAACINHSSHTPGSTVVKWTQLQRPAKATRTALSTVLRIKSTLQHDYTHAHVHANKAPRFGPWLCKEKARAGSNALVDSQVTAHHLSSKVRVHARLCCVVCWLTSYYPG